MRLLNIESSPRGSRSASIAVTSAFIEVYCQAYPGVVVDTLNVWEEKLPDFDQEACRRHRPSAAAACSLSV
jgi:FMN-dependent NADH-azoreductase